MFWIAKPSPATQGSVFTSEVSFYGGQLAFSLYVSTARSGQFTPFQLTAGVPHLHLIKPPSAIELCAAADGHLAPTFF